MKIELNISDKNEGTCSPWWAIVNPSQNMSLDIDIAASQITGPFFSREEAQEFLDRTRYNFSKRAVVYCFSGYHSNQYKEALRKEGEIE